MSCPFKAGDVVKDNRDGKIYRVTCIPGKDEYDRFHYTSPELGIQAEFVDSMGNMRLTWKPHAKLSLWRPNE